MGKVVLVSSDEQYIEVSEAIARTSAVLKDVLDIIKNCHSAIPIYRVDGDTLRLVFKWVKHHSNDTGKEWYHQENVKQLVHYGPDMDQPIPTNIDEWDIKFFHVYQMALANIQEASYFLHIPGLSHMLGKLIAMMVRGKTVGTLRRLIDKQPNGSEDSDDEDKSYGRQCNGGRAIAYPFQYQ